MRSSAPGHARDCAGKFNPVMYTDVATFATDEHDAATAVMRLAGMGFEFGPPVAKHGGCIGKITGDGLCLSFPRDRCDDPRPTGRWDHADRRWR